MDVAFRGWEQCWEVTHFSWSECLVLVSISKKAESKPDLVDSKQELDFKIQTKAKTRFMVLFMCGIGIIIKI